VTNTPLPPYSGHDRYVFVCYSHEDASRVYEEIRWLQDQGANVWYDEGISPGEEWSEELGRAIQGADRVLFFVSPRSVTSRHCRNEVLFAQNHDVPILSIHLEETSLPPGVDLTISSSQAVFAHRVQRADYRRRVLSVLDASGLHSRGPAGAHNATIGRASGRPLRYGRWIAVACVVAASLVVTWWVQRETSSVRVDREGPRIAVMPFETVAGNADDAYLGSGLAEEIAAALSKFPSLVVIPPSVTTRLQGSSDPNAAEQLGVSYLVRGRVHRTADGIRVSASLVDPIDGAQPWAEVYDQALDLDDVLSVQADIAQQIAATLADATGVVSKVGLSQLNRRSAESFEAYDCVLRGNAYIAIHDDETHLKARDCLEAVVQTDPGYGDAWAHLAYLYEEEFHHNRNVRPRPLERALEAARRAKELAPDNPVGSFALAMTQFSLGEIDAALQQFETILQVYPNYTTALAAYAVTSMYAGQLTQGFELVEQARHLNPTPPAWIYTALGAGHYLAGDYEDALRELNNFGPVFDVQTELFRVATLGRLGHLDAARAALARLEAEYPAFEADPDAELARYLVLQSTIDAVADGIDRARGSDA